MHRMAKRKMKVQIKQLMMNRGALRAKNYVSRFSIYFIHRPGKGKTQSPFEMPLILGYRDDNIGI